MYGINSHVSYLGVDPEMFKPLEVSEEKFILSVGTFTPEKGHGFLVDSLAHIDSEIRPKLIVVSNSSYPPWKTYLEKHASELNVDMEILSLINDDELAVLYNQAELCCLFTLSGTLRTCSTRINGVRNTCCGC